MKTLILGPTFSITTSQPVEAATARLAAWIGSETCPFAGSGVGDHFQLDIAPRDPARHFWSPHLTIEVRASDGGSVVAGRFNPSPAIWTAYLLGSLALLTIAVGGSMWGVAQVMLHESPWALLAMPICTVVGAVMWWASAVGQRLARAQMDDMHRAVEAVVAPMVVAPMGQGPESAR